MLEIRNKIRGNYNFTSNLILFFNLLLKDDYFYKYPEFVIKRLN